MPAFNSTIVALRSRGQNDELRIGKSCHRDPPSRWCGVARRHHRSPTLAMQPAGQDPEARLVPGTVTVPLCSRPECQSFLDNVIAGLGQIGAWNDPRISVKLRTIHQGTIFEYREVPGPWRGSLCCVRWCMWSWLIAVCRRDCHRYWAIQPSQQNWGTAVQHGRGRKFNPYRQHHKSNT